MPSSFPRAGAILISGARGAVAGHLLRHLTGAGADVRAASSTPRPHETLLNLHDPATFAPALRGVAQVFLYANPATAAGFAAAAAEAGVQHIVLLSSNAVTGVPDPHANPMAAPFLATEAALAAGPVAVTVLRPGAFAGNARQWVHGIRTRRRVDLPHPHARLDTVDERDVAEVALHALTTAALRGTTLDLTGPAAISLTDQVNALADALGEEISINTPTREQWKESVSRYLTEDYADALLDYWRSLELRPAPITTTIPDITGHLATGFPAWVRDNIGQYRHASNTS